MAAFPGALLQDPAPLEPVEPPVAPRLEPELDDVHARMRALLLQIEEGLRDVDDVLWSAGTEPAFVLRDATDRAQKVVDDIDLLIEIAKHPHEGGGSGSEP